LNKSCGLPAEYARTVGVKNLFLLLEKLLDLACINAVHASASLP
jgi:hypothetical protein